MICPSFLPVTVANFTNASVAFSDSFAVNPNACPCFITSKIGLRSNGDCRAILVNDSSISSAGFLASLIASLMSFTWLIWRLVSTLNVSPCLLLIAAALSSILVVSSIASSKSACRRALCGRSSFDGSFSTSAIIFSIESLMFSTDFCLPRAALSKTLAFSISASVSSYTASVTSVTVSPIPISIAIIASIDWVVRSKSAIVLNASVPKSMSCPATDFIASYNPTLIAVVNKSAWSVAVANPKPPAA